MRSRSALLTEARLVRPEGAALQGSGVDRLEQLEQAGRAAEIPGQALDVDVAFAQRLERLRQVVDRRRERAAGDLGQQVALARQMHGLSRGVGPPAELVDQR